MFDEKRYTYELIDASSLLFVDYLSKYKKVKDNSARVRPKTITLEWLEEEIGRAFNRDLNDPFYKDEDMFESLVDVARPYRGNMLLVFDQDGYMLGKIGYHFNDETATTHAMYLYVFGDRRRNLKQKHINGPFIIWYFVALLSIERYGDLARIYIPHPRDTVTKRLYELGSRFVFLEPNMDNLIMGKITDSSPETHKQIAKSITNGAFPHNFAALMPSTKVVRRVQEIEELLSSVR
jgi:hypothetical protein